MHALTRAVKRVWVWYFKPLLLQGLRMQDLSPAKSAGHGDPRHAAESAKRGVEAIIGVPMPHTRLVYRRLGKLAAVGARRARLFCNRWADSAWSLGSQPALSLAGSGPRRPLTLAALF